MTVDTDPEAARRAENAGRRALFERFFDPTVGRGLEIGPLDRPIGNVETDDVAFVELYDHPGMLAAYEADPAVWTPGIPPIDFWLVHDDRVLTVQEAAAPGAPFDWVFASHVIEHVPDLIGWLGQISALTAPAARLILAVPDRRYCFDRHRPPTTVGQMVAAHEAGLTAPDARAFYDYVSSMVTVDTAGLWRGERPAGREHRTFGPRAAWDRMPEWRTGAYIDSHVWTFTPTGLVQQIAELREIGIIDWYVEQLEPTQENRLEFYAVLQRVPADGAPFEEVPVATDLPDWLEDEWTTRQALREANVANRRQAKEIRRLERRIADLESSTSWRLGQRITRPAAAVRRRLGGPRRSGR